MEMCGAMRIVHGKAGMFISVFCCVHQSCFGDGDALSRAFIVQTVSLTQQNTEMNTNGCHSSARLSFNLAFYPPGFLFPIEIRQRTTDDGEDVF